MNLQSIERMMSMLPEGPKKEALRQKINKLATKSTKRGGDGLKDSFELKPTGHIMIEEIDAKGNVVEVLADQPNLVVDGAEEIVLRSFSGDPHRILYKNRLPKEASTNKFYIEESKLGSEMFDGAQLLHAPNILWSAVNDEEFDISYGYYPVTVFIKEESSSEFGKKAFSVHQSQVTGSEPMSAEIYSTYSNLFIGIGEGKNYPVQLTDSRISYSDSVGGAGAFTVTENRAETLAEGDQVVFTQKISNFKIDIEKSNTGAQIDVFIDGVLKETIETFDSSLTEPVIETFEYDSLDYSKETEVKLVHSGGDVSVTSPLMVVTGVHFDALNKGMNSLIKEFENFEVDFMTPASYNTSSMAPYTIKLPHFPLKTDSVKVTYEGIPFTEVKSEGELTDNAFLVDELHGVVRFNRALTGVLISFSITGEIYDNEKVETLLPGFSVDFEVSEDTSMTNVAATGTVDGLNKNFSVPNQNLVADSLVAYVDGVGATIESFDLSLGTFVLTTAPVEGSVVTADYSYTTTSQKTAPLYGYKTDFSINEGSAKVYDQDGNALTVYTGGEFKDGMFMVDTENPNLIKLSQNKADGNAITKIEVVYQSDEKPGLPTGYTRAIIEKPKTINEYPWFELDKGSVRFVAEFPELKPSHNVTIREMGLFDGPRVEDKIAGFKNYPVKAFSLVRVGETRKDVSTGIRITWTITLLNEDGLPFQGGR